MAVMGRYEMNLLTTHYTQNSPILYQGHSIQLYRSIRSSKAMQSQFVVSQATFPEISSRMRLINDNFIHRILIEDTPLISSINGNLILGIKIPTIKKEFP